jgi:hypothetical protein
VKNLFVERISGAHSSPKTQIENSLRRMNRQQLAAGETRSQNKVNMRDLRNAAGGENPSVANSVTKPSEEINKTRFFISRQKRNHAAENRTCLESRANQATNENKYQILDYEQFNQKQIIFL